MSQNITDDNTGSELQDRTTTVEEKTFGNVIRSLSIIQVWSVIGIIFMLLSGSFGLGYKLRTNVAKAEIANIKVEVSTLKAELKKLNEKTGALSKRNDELVTKERFLTFYIRYIEAKAESDKSPSDQELLIASKDAAEDIISFLKQQLSLSLPYSKEKTNRNDIMRIGIGRTQKESVIIFSDGTKWSLPFEIAKSPRLRCYLCP